MKSAAMAVILLLVTLPLNGAGIYRWTDEMGRTHFGDQPPEGAAAEPVRLSDGQAPSGTRAPAQQAVSATTPSARVRQIRCRDFQGALVQLQQAEAASEDDPQWTAARERAEAGVHKWCE
jgi:hypothetical protein